MTDHLDFEQRLEARLRSRAASASRPFDAAAIAHRAALAARPRREMSRLAWPSTPRRRAWLAVGLLAAAAAAVGIVVGAWLLSRPHGLPGVFRPVGPMSVQHDLAASAALKDGRILVVGGVGQDGVPAPAPGELFDPATDTFSATAGPSSGSRVGLSATTLPDGRVLIAGGSRPDTDGVSVPSASAELFDPTTGTFRPTGHMTTARTVHTATLLADGRVLVIGGESVDQDGAATSLASAEIFDPAAGTWSAVGAMSQPRQDYTATVLPDGRALVAGGLTEGPDGAETALATAELFDPSTGTFGPAASMMVARFEHTATALDDGRVLIVGGGASKRDGAQEEVLASAELYDPATGRFSATGSLATERLVHTAIRLADGRVLVVGGMNVFGSPRSAELYDPATGTFVPAVETPESLGGQAVRLHDGRVLFASDPPWVFDPSGSTPVVTIPARTDRIFKTTGDPAQARSGHTATMLRDGRVLIAGGRVPGSGIVPTAEIYDPKTGSFSATGSMSVARAGHSALLLADGRVLVTGGALHSWAIEIYDPQTGRFDDAGTLPSVSPLTWDPIKAVQLTDGRIIVLDPGDAVDDPTADTIVDELDLVSRTLTQIATLPTCGGVQGAVVLGDGRILAMCSTSTRILDLDTGQSTRLDVRPETGPASMVRLADGRVLFSGGLGASNVTVYDPTTEQAVRSEPLVSGSSTLTATPLTDGRILIVSGSEASLWTPATGVSQQLPPPIAARDGHTATNLRDGRVLIVGGTDWSADRGVPQPVQAEVFDPTASP